jgi:hypothetical protein
VSRLDTCRLCPRLCRDACPVSAAASEVGTPTFLAEILGRHEEGRVDDATARDAVTRCTDCGGCQEHCHLHRPLPTWLREARAALLPRPAVAPVGEVDGPDDAVVWIATDDREPLIEGAVARLRTPDRLGVSALEHGGLEVHFAQLRVRLAGRTVVVADGGVGAVLRAAGVPFRWLWEVVSDPAPAQGSCVAGGARGLGCCGGGGPLAAHHPEQAALVARLFAERGGLEVRDARCRDHLRRCGHEARDTVDRAGGPR